MMTTITAMTSAMMAIVRVFIWGLLPDGSFVGDWRDYTAQSGGPSVMSRVH